jgi:hypothetical protein
LARKNFQPTLPDGTISVLTAPQDRYMILLTVSRMQDATLTALVVIGSMQRDFPTETAFLVTLCSFRVSDAVSPFPFLTSSALKHLIRRDLWPRLLSAHMALTCRNAVNDAL